MTEAGNEQTRQRMLQTLSPEEQRSDLYVTALHELEHRRQNWSIRRLEKIASDIGIDESVLGLTWCVTQAVVRTRRKRAPVRLGVNKAYTRLVGGVQKPEVKNGISEDELRRARESLRAAGWRELAAMRRVHSLLTGREKEIELRDCKEFMECEESDEENDTDPLITLCRNGVRSLPGVEDIPEEKVSDVSRRVMEFARSVGEGDAGRGASKEARSMARHRYKALEWMVRCERRERDTADMGAVIDEIGEEAGVRLHPMTKRILQDAFHDERSLCEGRLEAFRGIVPECFMRAVREREVRKLLGMMKRADESVAEELVKRFGSAEICLRRHVKEIGRDVTEMIHGVDNEFHEVVEGRVRNVWMVARVMKDKFGEIEDGRRAGFWKILNGENEVIELCSDERVAFFEGVNDGEMKRNDGWVLWNVFKGLCEAGVEDCVSVLGRLMAEFEEEGVVKGLLESDLRFVCCLIGINSDAMTSLRRFVRDLL